VCAPSINDDVAMLGDHAATLVGHGTIWMLLHDWLLLTLPGPKADARERVVVQPLAARAGR